MTEVSDQLVPRRRRAGGRAAHAGRRAGVLAGQRPWAPPVNSDRPTEPLGDDGIAAIHDGAMRVLEEVGVEFLNEEALELFRRAGVRVDGTNVRMGRDFVMEMVGRAPAAFDITPRNPARQLRVGDGSLLFGTSGGPPSFWSLEGGKVPGTRAACADFFRLGQAFNCIHFNAGYPVEPVDLHPSVRHLHVLGDLLTLTDKVVHAYSLGPARVEDAMEMVRLAAGLSESAFTATPRMFTNINSTSPLKHDIPMIDGCLRMIRRGQAVIVTPFTLAGAMAPVTLSGAVTLSIAEALSAIALFQYVRPGAACVLGTFTTNVDMKSGAPAFGTPEYLRATQMTGQMARFYGLPLRSSGVCAANIPDGQAMWETLMSLWAAIQSGTNMVMHSAGWLEGGLVGSLEKFVMDAQVLEMLSRYFDPALVATDPADIALEAIAEVGSSGHYFGIEHTRARYESAFLNPFLSDWRNFEAWVASGATWTAARAGAQAQEILGGFEAPPMEDAARAALEDFIARRVVEGGAPTEY